MSFQTIPGQERAKRMLQNGLQQDTLSHAYIFSGPVGSGRERMALALAKAVFCTENREEACGQCLACRKAEHGNHPDLYVIEPDGASIKIDQIRDLQKQFAYRTGAGQRKIVILKQAEKMTLQAANSLLKFLEEPQSAMIAIMIAENGQALLPTIRSRAQWIPFTPMAKRAMEQLLVGEGNSHSIVRAAAQLTAGLDAARSLVQEPWFAEARNVVIQLAKDTLTRLPGAAVAAQQKVVKTELAERLPVLLDLWLLWLKDMIQLQSGNKEDIVYIDQAEAMMPLALSKGPQYWVACMEHVLEAQKRLRTNANPQLVLEQLMIAMNDA
ncbi:DNA polymerase III subunit delta' [Paenibacillus sp. MBLB4367]|uniref:DNA polymerase III subunit delta' n=1 Tax=Paenibacillus sp. MBLB4367 TaxID=3384767 RepID=UPI00390811F5